MASGLTLGVALAAAFAGQADPAVPPGAPVDRMQENLDAEMPQSRDKPNGEPASSSEPPPGPPAQSHSQAQAQLGKLPSQLSDPQPAPKASPPRMQFLDADGNPLPDEVQEELKKQFKESPPIIIDTPEPSASTAPIQTSTGDILVSGQRPRGSVIGDIPAERTFDTFDIGAYGVGNVRELLDALAPQVSSGRGRGDGGPVTLLNGRRVSSFAEIAEIPTEAIERMEVFPEETALDYGYRADQKVVNIITREKFNSQFGQLASSIPTEGGYDAETVQANHFAIRGNTRFSLGGDYSRTSALLESERGLAQLGAPEAGRFRTLLGGTDRLSINGLMSGAVIDDVSSTLNGRYDFNKTNSLLGPGPRGPLMRSDQTRVAHLGTSLGGAISKWQWSFTGNYDRMSSDTHTDTSDATITRSDTAKSVNSLANADLVVNGSPLRAPAGPISTSIRLGGDVRDFNSRSSRRGIAQRADLSRDRGAIQANVTLPVANAKRPGLDWLGDLSLNANVAVEQLSDFGTLRTFGYGMSWSPIDALSIIASATNEEAAPSVEQLGDPLIVTPNVRTFDFGRRQVVDVARVFGGNPMLRSDDRHVARVGITAKPLSEADLTLGLEYLNTRIDDPIALFPIATPEIEAAFPERFTRDTDGRLLQIDSTPLNYARSAQEQLRWTLSFVRPLGAVDPMLRNAPVKTFANEAEARAALPPGTMMAMVQPGGAMARRFENMASRMYVNFSHTWQLRDEVRLRQGRPVLDRLDGSATDIFGGARRHRFELQAGVFKKGLGGRVTLDYQSGTKVRDFGSAVSDLSFSDLATVDLNLFANLDDAVGGSAARTWLKGARATFGITNVFNSRQQIRDALGLTPLSYQSAYLDPLGRYLSFGLRKVF